ncbi:hypothetical protein [Leptolyngbya sp. NIES-2104]|uniref:hypothetical protein n=1 Tax=Leptolyngbya sp. NIES-2104 TaxID=1552121 RepID=UPI0006EC9106|nr:hypothetical protein [Leptolyngbya sp. NIES-2104]GAP94457.1 hypothetical protein NIES2104_09680 [Leptolyngbya sp. NIES-2104]
MSKPLFLIIPIVSLVISSPVFAQTIPNLSSLDRQRISRDLTPPNSQDFFNQGREQFEREIRRLNERSQQKQENLLKVDPATRYPEDQSLRLLNRITLKK